MYVVLVTFLGSYLFYKVQSQGCLFPKEMYDTEHPWRILTRDFDVKVYHQYRRLMFQVSDMFTMDYMEGRTGDKVVKTISYKCLQQKENTKYYIKKESEGHGDVYQCIQFLVRNTNIVQWKLSVESTTEDQSLCSENKLKLMDDPLIYYYRNGFWREERNRNISYKSCPLDGGYLLEWKDPQTGTHMCEKKIPPLKIENDCTKGQGLRFHAAQKEINCKGRDAQILNIQFMCLGHWNEAGHTYMLIGQPNEEWNQIYCIRLPQDHKDKFSGHIFLDATCDSTADITKSRDYRQISLQKQVVKKLCADETPACIQYNGEDCDLSHAATCRKACRVCESDEDIGEPGVHFASHLHGAWLKHTNRLGREMVTITDRTFDIPSMSKYRILGDSACRRKIDKSPRGKSNEYIMVTLYKNGCSPQMVSMIITNRSASVLSYTLSQYKVLEMSIDVNDDLESIVNNNVWGYQCSHVEYKADVDPIYDTYRPYKGGWFNLVKTGPGTTSVPCDIPLNKTLWHIHFQGNNDANCTGEIMDGRTPNQLNIYIASCVYPPHTDTISISRQTFTYECLANFQGDEMELSSDQTFLITHAQGSNILAGEFYQCWVFIPERLTAYWVPVSECDSNIVHHIEAKFKVPDATLTFSSGCRQHLLCQIVLLFTFGIVFFLQNN